MPLSRLPFLAIAGLAVLCPRGATAQRADDAQVRKSVVKITASLRPPNVFRPWAKTSPQEVTGSGVVIPGKLILTNAHMVNHAAQAFVQPEGSSEKLPAKVKAVAPGIDLALLSLEDESFFDAHPPLAKSAKQPGCSRLSLLTDTPKEAPSFRSRGGSSRGSSMETTAC